MLKNFIRFSALNKCIPYEGACDPVVYECPPKAVYKMPAKPSDIIKFVIERAQVNGYTEGMLKASLVKCGELVYDNIGTFEEAGPQLFVTVEIPGDAPDCDYQIVISLDFKLKIVDYAPESEEPCSAAVALGIEGIDGFPVGDYLYSKDGINFQSSPLFEGICSDLEYTFYIKYGDFTCLAGDPLTIDFAGLGCGNYAGTTIQDLIDLNVYGFQIDNCTGNDFI